MPIFFAVRIARQAISPRLAMRIFLKGVEFESMFPLSGEVCVGNRAKLFYNGRLSCLRHGFSSCLVASIERDRHT